MLRALASGGCGTVSRRADAVSLCRLRPRHDPLHHGDDRPLHEADRDRWATSIDAFCAATQFDGLTIHAHTEESTEGAVDFSAQLSVGEEDRSFREHSRFTKRGGRWLYWGPKPDRSG